MLYYIYSEQNRVPLTEENAQSLYLVADKYESPLWRKNAPVCFNQSFVWILSILISPRGHLARHEPPHFLWLYHSNQEKPAAITTALYKYIPLPVIRYTIYDWNCALYWFTHSLISVPKVVLEEQMTMIQTPVFVTMAMIKNHEKDIIKV